MNHRAIIFNRAPASQNGWIHIVPKGELPNPAAGIVQVLDDTSLDSILAGIQKDKNRLGANWPGIYAGREHFIYDAGQDSAALGWFKDFQKRDDGIWAKDDGLTLSGQTAVKNGEYKFTSFVTDPSDLQKLPGKQGSLPRYRVTGIETVGFTNHANGKELLTPITNRGEDATINNRASYKAVGTGDTAGFEFDFKALEDWCNAVMAVEKSGAKAGRVMLTFQAAWTYAKAHFPELYEAAFNPAGDDDDDGGAAAAAAASKQASVVANRVAKLAGKNFHFGWNFVAEDLPMLFNRMTAPQGRVLNRLERREAQFSPAGAAKVFNRLVQAEQAVKSVPHSAAYAAVHKAHPGLSGLAHGKLLGSEAVREEPSLSSLLA